MQPPNGMGSTSHPGGQLRFLVLILLFSAPLVFARGMLQQFRHTGHRMYLLLDPASPNRHSLFLNFFIINRCSTEVSDRVYTVSQASESRSLLQQHIRSPPPPPGPPRHALTNSSSGQVILYKNHYFVTGGADGDFKIRRCTSPQLNDCVDVNARVSDHLTAPVGILQEKFSHSGGNHGDDPLVITNLGAKPSEMYFTGCIFTSPEFSHCFDHEVVHKFESPLNIAYHGTEIVFSSLTEHNAVKCHRLLVDCSDLSGANTGGVAHDGRHWVFGHVDKATGQYSVNFCPATVVNDKCVKQTIPSTHPLKSLDGITFDGTRWYFATGSDSSIVICLGGSTGFKSCQTRHFPLGNDFYPTSVYTDGRGNYYIGSYKDGAILHCRDPLLHTCSDPLFV